MSVARSKSIRVRPAARRRSGTRPSRSSSARSAAPSRRTTSTRDRRDRRARSRRGAARDARRRCAAGRPSGARVQCQSCKAIIGLRSRRASGRRCEFCGSPALVAYEEIKRRSGRRACCRSRSPRPRCASRSAAGTRASGSRPDALKARALVDTVHGVYIPYWTFDAQVDCPWEAEAGHYYYTTETLPRQPGPAPQTRQVQHVRWEPASGVVDHFFDDEPVPGTQRRRSQRCCGRSSRFRPTSWCRTTRRFSRASSSSTTRSCCSTRRRRPRTRCARSCGSSAPRRCRATRTATCVIHPTFSAQTFKHILVPVWLLTYTYGAKVYQVLVNGHTGRMAGQYPEEPWKVAFLVIGIIIVVLILLMTMSNQ